MRPSWSSVEFGAKAEIAISTDGLSEQPGLDQQENEILISPNEFAGVASGGLHLAVVDRYLELVNSAGGPNDDVCVVTVYHAPEGIRPEQQAIDQQLVQQILGDVPGAFDAFLRRYKNLVWCQINRILHAFNDDDREEAYQIVAIHIWRQISKWNGGQLDAFVTRVAINKTIDVLRPAIRSGMLEWLTDDIDAAQSRNEPADVEQLSFARLIADEDVELVRAALEELRLIERESTGKGKKPKWWATIIDLHYFEGLSMVEVAQKLGMRTNTCFNQRRKALEMLLGKLDPKQACGEGFRGKKVDERP